MSVYVCIVLMKLLFLQLTENIFENVSKKVTF